MADINFKAKLIVTNFDNEIKRQIRARIKEQWINQSDEIRRLASIIFYEEIKAHPTYEDLATQGGYLRGALGVTNQLLDNFMDNLRDAIPEMFQIKYVAHTGATDLGGILAYINDFQDQFNNLTEGTDYTSTGRHAGYVPWFRWLMREGMQDVVFDFYFMQRDGSGRTNQGLMIPNTKGRNFHIDSPYAGVPNDNWFTEAAEIARPKIIEMILLRLQA